MFTVLILRAGSVEETVSGNAVRTSTQTPLSSVKAKAVWKCFSNIKLAGIKFSELFQIGKIAKITTSLNLLLYSSYKEWILILIKTLWFNISFHEKAALEDLPSSKARPLLFQRLPHDLALSGFLSLCSKSFPGCCLLMRGERRSFQY